MSLEYVYRFFEWLFRNSRNEQWHKCVPLLPRLTIDRGIVWLWPAYRRFWCDGGSDPDSGYEWRMRL